MDIKFNFEILSQDELSSLKGGNAAVLFEREQMSESGDGAKYACCIEIGLIQKPIKKP